MVVDTASLRAIALVLEEFRKVDPEMQMQAAAVFLAVASRDDAITMTELREAVGISQSSVSRNVAALGQINRLHGPGFNLLEAREDPEERRRKIVALTPKGRTLARALAQALNGSTPPLQPSDSAQTRFFDST